MICKGAEGSKGWPSEAIIGFLHANSHSLLNGHSYCRMAEDYRMLSEKDAFACANASGISCGLHIRT